MKTRRKWVVAIVTLLLLYSLLPLIIFDFRNHAVPYDESNHQGTSVVIGPRPRSWVPFAGREIDIPGGAGYDSKGWVFRLWKPLCLLYAKANGYAPPAEWR